MSQEIPKLGEDGRWHIEGRSFATNEQAWRWLDKQEGELRSPKEDHHDWSFRQSTSGD